QGTEGINTLQRPYSGLVERRYTAGLFYLYISGRPVPAHVPDHIDSVGVFDTRIDFIFKPVLLNFLLNNSHIPSIASAEITGPPDDADCALRVCCAEHAVRPAHRTAFAIRNLVRVFWFGFRFALRCARDGLWFRLCVLVWDRDRLRFLFLHLRLRLR